MPKKSRKKSKKKSKKSKKKVDKFHEGESEFTFNNSDKYEGHYCAHTSGVAWRQGLGVYLTHDEQLYEGFWKDDKLDEKQNLQITYKNGDKYNGKIRKYKYNGPGTYTLQNGGRLSCHFEGNKPSGNLIYIDHHDRLWFGKAEKEHAVLHYEHVFSFELDEARGKGSPLYPPPPPEEETPPLEEQASEELDWKELERQIFAKSTKTKADIDFTDSPWYWQYQNCAKMQNRVANKLQLRQPLNEEEKKWYEKYKTSAKILDGFMKKGSKKAQHSTDLIKQYLNESLRCICRRAPHVFYTTCFDQVEGELEQ